MPDLLRLDPDTTFDCLGCGRCCGSWQVHATEEERARIEALPWGEIPEAERVAPHFNPVGPGLWAVGKAAGGQRCAFLRDDRRCVIHAHWGAAAKPAMCRRFPFEQVASDEAVWVTANHGCPGVQGEAGRPFADHRQDIEAIFAVPLAECRAGVAVSYPLTAAVSLPDSGIEVAFQGLRARLEGDLFAALRQVAAFVAAAPEPGEPEPARRPASAAEIPSALRFAFALTLYKDAVDASSFWGRLGGVFTLPKMLGFQHVYKSRLLGIDVDMSAVLAHPGTLPPESEALLLRVLRARLHGRKVFQGTPHATAGLTRALLELDAVLFFARALAAGRAIAHEDVWTALSAVELRISSQGAARGLAGLDPRLRQAWGDPEVARAAAQVFAPAV
jgi:Fe-S-cluster containining protein